MEITACRIWFYITDWISPIRRWLEIKGYQNKGKKNIAEYNSLDMSCVERFGNGSISVKLFELHFLLLECTLSNNINRLKFHFCSTNLWHNIFFIFFNYIFVILSNCFSSELRLWNYFIYRLKTVRLIAFLIHRQNIEYFSVRVVIKPFSGKDELDYLHDDQSLRCNRLTSPKTNQIFTSWI